MMNKPTIESRIAGMLSAADAKSDAIAALITEVEVAAQEADATATKTREEALDPATVIDAAKVGASVATAELTRDRLRAALPRLQEQLKQAREREYAECWLNDYAAVKARRDAVAQQLRERYPQLVEELVTLMTSIAATDKEVDRINVAAPYGDYPRLRGVELTARGLDRLHAARHFHPARAAACRTSTRDDGPLLAYPPPRADLGRRAHVAADILRAGGIGARNGWKRDRRRREENARLDAFYEKRSVREAREAARPRQSRGRRKP